jgi:hypothetical protein
MYATQTFEPMTTPRSDKGSSLLEYAIMVVLSAAICIVSITALG